MIPCTFFIYFLILHNHFILAQSYLYMKPILSFTQTEEYRRDELIRIIEHSLEKLTLQELEALYYDMSTKNYIND